MEKKPADVAQEMWDLKATLEARSRRERIVRAADLAHDALSFVRRVVVFLLRWTLIVLAGLLALFLLIQFVKLAWYA
jgi:hypothetical protein